MIESKERGRHEKLQVTTVLIHWKIRPDEESRRKFLRFWGERLDVERANMVGEFLSEPLTKDEVGFHCDIFGQSSDYTSFFNVGIWRDAESFKRDVYDRVAKNRNLESFEFELPDRMVLQAINCRIGDFKLPEADRLALVQSSSG